MPLCVPCGGNPDERLRSLTPMACPDAGTNGDPGTTPGTGSAADACFGLSSAPESKPSDPSDPAVLAAFQAAAWEIGHNARRRDIRRNVRNHRQRLRARGLRPVQFWLPDLRRSDAQEQARFQSRAVTWSYDRSSGWSNGWSNVLSLPTPSVSASEPRTAIARGELRVLLDSAPFPAALQPHLERLPREAPKEDAREQPQIAVILLDNAFSELSTTLVCPLTTRLSRAPLLRVPLNPSAVNGLRRSHQLMLDGLTTVPRQQLGACIGRLSDEDLKRLGLALLVVSGLAR